MTSFREEVEKILRHLQIESQRDDVILSELVDQALDQLIELKDMEREDTSKVTRFEVINHCEDGEGREMVKWGVKVMLSFQDNDRTLKVFLSDPERSRLGEKQ